MFWALEVKEQTKTSLCRHGVYVLVVEDRSLTSKEISSGSWGGKIRERHKAGQVAGLAKEDGEQKVVLP